MPDLFADFNGIAADAVTAFYQHEQNRTNRMIPGDSLQVMASPVEQEGLRGRDLCRYSNLPSGIGVNATVQGADDRSVAAVMDGCAIASGFRKRIDRYVASEAV